MEQYSLPLSGPGTIYLYILKLHYKYTVYNIQNILRNIHETSPWGHLAELEFRTEGLKTTPFCIKQIQEKFWNSNTVRTRDMCAYTC